MPPADNGENVGRDRGYLAFYKVAVAIPIDRKTNHIGIGADIVDRVAGNGSQIDDVQLSGMGFNHPTDDFETQWGYEFEFFEILPIGVDT
jgi:hypothetical protein